MSSDNDSYQGKFDYAADCYGARAEFLKVGDNFNPEVGFLRRDDFKRSFGQLRFSPRPQNMPSIRKFTYQGSLEYIENGAGLLETRQQSGRFEIELDNSDRFTAEANGNYEFLQVPFEVSRGVVIPVGGYGFTDAVIGYNFGQQRPVSGNVSLTVGQFYDGDITTIAYSQSRVTADQALLAGAELVNQQGQSAVRQLRDPCAPLARRLRLLAAHVRQRAAPYNDTDRTFSSNLRYRWIPARQRVLPRVDRRAEHQGAWTPPAQPRVRRQGDAAAAVLTAHGAVRAGAIETIKRYDALKNNPRCVVR